MDKKKIKVAMLCDSVDQTTGNSKVAREMIKGLSALGYEMYNIAVGHGDLPEQDRGHFKLLPINHENYNENSVAMFLNKLTMYIERDKYDYLIILGDEIYYTYLGLGNIDKEFLAKCGTKIITWMTIDTDVRLCMESAYHHLTNPKFPLFNPASNIVTTSFYGKDVLEEDFLKVDKVIYPHVDTEIFTPLTEDEKTNLRTRYRFNKDDFIFITVARNMRRKNNELVLEALYPLMIKHKNIRWFGIIPEYNKLDEINLIEFVKNKLTMRYGGRDLIAEKRILFANANKKPLQLAYSKITDEEVKEFYQLSDATISGSSNEGFGSSFVESIAVGNPFITLNHTTIPELTDNGKYAFVAEDKGMIYVGQGARVNVTWAKDMQIQAEKVYDLMINNKEEYNKLRSSLVQYAKKFDVKRMVKEWDEYIKHLEGD